MTRTGRQLLDEIVARCPQPGQSVTAPFLAALTLTSTRTIEQGLERLRAERLVMRTDAGWVPTPAGRAAVLEH